MDSKQGTLEQERLREASSDEIRREIRGTRREMDDTLDQLGERLHPRHLIDDVLDVFRSDGGAGAKQQIAHTMKGASKTVAREVRQHPLPALLVGAGLVWWLYDSMGGGDDIDDYGYDEESRRYARAGLRYAPGTRRPLPNSGGYVQGGYAGYSDADELLTTDMGYAYADTAEGYEQDGPGAMDKAKDLAAGVGDKVSDAASAIGSKVSSAASHLGDAVSGAASAAGHRVAGTASHVGHGVGHVGRRVGSAAHGGARTVAGYGTRGRYAVGRGAHKAQRGFRSASDEFPLAVGAGFLVAGLLAGLLLPRTEREDEWMGEMSDEIMDETRHMGQEIVQRSKTVLNETAASAMDEVEARGATPGNLADKVGHVVSAAVQAGKEAAREEGISGEDLKETAKAVGETVKETAQTRAKEEAKDLAPKQA